MFKVELKSIDISVDPANGLYRLRILDPSYKATPPYVYCSESSLSDIIISNLNTD